MSETEIWRGAFDEFGQGVYYDDLDGVWKIQVPTPKVGLNKKTSEVVGGPKTTSRQWKGQKLEDIFKDFSGLDKEEGVGDMVVGEVRAGRGSDEYGAFEPKTGRVAKAEGPTQKDALKGLFHEAQHGFQHKEGQTSGSSPERHMMSDKDFAARGMQWWSSKYF